MDSSFTRDWNRYFYQPRLAAHIQLRATAIGYKRRHNCRRTAVLPMPLTREGRDTRKYGWTVRSGLGRCGQIMRRVLSTVKPWIYFLRL